MSRIKNKVYVFRPHLVKQRMLSLCLSINEVANRMNDLYEEIHGVRVSYKPSNIDKIANGDVIPNVKILALLAAALECEPTSFYEVAILDNYSFDPAAERRLIDSVLGKD